MSVIALTSASGAPGVTTLAVGWAYRNAQPAMVVEGGATGGSAVLAGRHRGRDGHTVSILSLAQLRRLPMDEYLWEHTVPLDGTTDRWLLPAVMTHQQANALTGAWPEITRALRKISDEAGVDVFLDCGRLGTQYYPHDVLTVADAVLVLVNDTLPALNSCAIWLDQLRTTMDQRGGAHRLAVVPVAVRPPARELGERMKKVINGGRPYSLELIADAFQPTKTLPPIAWDPDAANVYSQGLLPPRRFDKGSYCRSLDSLRAATTAFIRESDDLLAGRLTA